MGQELFDRRDVDGRLIERLPRPQLAERHDLLPHPEGGWYRSTWTSPVMVTDAGRRRPTATAILFLLPVGEVSAWHRVTSDELWIWHGPAPLEIEVSRPGPTPGVGPVRPLHAGSPQVLVPADHWQRTLPSDGDVLVTCIVSPGFDFADFTMLPGG